MQYRENLGNQSVDMAKVKCNICTWIVVEKFILNQHLKIENLKSSNAKNAMNYAWMLDMMHKMVRNDELVNPKCSKHV